MCKSVYPIELPQLKFDDCVLPALSPQNSALVTVSCNFCGRVLCAPLVKSESRVPFSAAVPEKYCLCTMSQMNLLTLVEGVDPFTKDHVWTQVLGNLAHAAMICGATLEAAEECVEEADLIAFEDMARDVLRERTVRNLKARVDAGAYVIQNHAVAESMIRSLVMEAVAA